jgi:hypothetical protein
VILTDVNVLLYAMVERSSHHDLCRDEVERLRARPRDFAVSELVLAAVVRIATNPRVFRPCPGVSEVFEFIEALRAGSEVTRIEPGPTHWRLFRDLVETTGIQGPDTTDAYLAALAIEHDCEWWTTDSDFARFPGLRWRNLLA